MRTDEVLRRVEGLDREILDVCQTSGWVEPDVLAGGEDPRWWSERDLNRLRDILRFHRAGSSLEKAYEQAREDRFFGLCPCDWRR